MSERQLPCPATHAQSATSQLRQRSNLREYTPAPDILCTSREKLPLADECFSVFRRLSQLSSSLKEKKKKEKYNENENENER